PPSEGDDFSGLAGNRKYHPVAELGVHVNRRTILGAPTLVIPTEGRNLLFYSSIVITSEFRRFVCGVAGGVEGFAVFLTADGCRLGAGFLPSQQTPLSYQTIIQL